MELQIDKRFHNLTLEQVQTLDKVLTEIIPIHGRGNFPTLEVSAKDMIRMVKDRLVERQIRVKDVRLDGCTASHVMVQDNGMGYSDLDIIFGLELPRREDFQVIKEVVLGSLRDLLPRGVNRRKITCLTMKEAYVQKMVKVFNERDRWSLISLSNNRGKTVGLRFVSSQRRQFEFSVDSFQIILDRMLESYWETERKQGGHLERLLYCDDISDLDDGGEKTEPHPSTVSLNLKEDNGEISAMTSSAASPWQNQKVTVPEEDVPLAEHVNGKHKVELSEMKSTGLNVVSLEDEDEGVEDVPSKEDIVFEVSGEKVEEKRHFKGRDFSTVSPCKTSPTQAVEPLGAHVCTDLRCHEEKLSESKAFKQLSAAQMERQETVHCHKPVQFKPDSSICRTDNTSTLPRSHLESSCPPPAKRTCSTSQDHVPDYFPLPNLPREISQRMSTTSMMSTMSVPENVSLSSELATQLFQPTDILKTIRQKPILMDGAQVHPSNPPRSYDVTASEAECTHTHTGPTYRPDIACQAENVAEPKHSETPPNSMAPQESVGYSGLADTVKQPTLAGQDSGPTETISDSGGLDSRLGPGGGSGGLDSRLGPRGGSGWLDSRLGPGAGSGGLDSRLGPGGGSGGLDSRLGPGGGSGGLDSRLGPGGGSGGLDSGAGPGSPGKNPTITVEAECMFGDFKEAMDHLRFRLIATHSPEEIRGGGLLRYSDLLVRNFRPASETEIKSSQRYMCSRFFIDFPDVGEQQRKIEAYLRCHFVGSEETSKYDYLMTLRRVIDESTVCLMGHERRQTLNMITVLALRVLGEQNAIPNAANVTCFYQPAPYMAEPIFNSYYIAQAQPPLIYHPYPIQVHMQTGPV